MAHVELLDDRFVIHNKGARRLLTIVGRNIVAVPAFTGSIAYAAISLAESESM